MKKILAYPLSVLYYLFFGLTLVVFHVIQWLSYTLGGYQAHKVSVDWLCYFLVSNTYVLGTRYRFENLDKLPQGVPLIVVANHQSFYDIPAINWYMRKYHIKFISKIELGKGIPSISYNLRNGGSVLINRKDPRQSLREVGKLGEYIEKYNRSAVIFPEGTRSKTGKPKAFNESGIKVLCRKASSAYIVPITINNSWKMTRWGAFPLGIGNKLTFTIQEPFAIKGMPFEDIFNRVQDVIVSGINPGE